MVIQLQKLPTDESLGTLEPDVTANQLHRQAKYQNGIDLRQKPYTLFRIRIDAQPVLLR
ncbi:hypothetical protein [Nostoc sp.]|uniref:hypothetical protein n=1 Tax=Nostoc sp. TaxID=1180 RepID=UPI002FF7FFCB